MELARSELESAHLQHLVNNYLISLRASPDALREVLVADALRALSCAFGFSELLYMVPHHVKSFVGT